MGQSGFGSNDNEGVFCIPQSSSITGTSPSDCSVSYSGHLLEGVLPLCKDAVGIFYSPSQGGNAPFSRKSVVMDPFMFQKTVSMTFFTDCCALNFFLTEESVCFNNVDSFLTLVYSDKPIFSSFEK